MNQDSDSSDQPTGQDPLLLLKTLQLLWTKQELRKQLKEEIRRGFAGLEDPLAGLLAMLENSSDWKGKGHSLGYCITTELQLWIKEHPAVPQSGIQLKKLQARVLRILSQCPANLLDPLISIYQLHTADRNYLLEHVSHLYLKGDYKEAAILSIKLKLQPDQDVEKPQVYILTLCPNVVNQRHLRTLNYLFYKRFVEKTMTEENWADHVQSTAGDSRCLQGHLVQLLLRHCPGRAAWWARHWGLPMDVLPPSLAEELPELHTQQRVEEATKVDNYEDSKKKDCYQLPISRENIHFLQTWEETLQCWEKVLQPGQVVGVDMEWKPSFGMVGKPRVALLQMAVKDEVFLLDLPRLLEQAELEGEKEKLPRFIQMLYSDAAITKLGYGMSGDLSSLAATCSALKDIEKQLHGVVDLLTVDKQLQKGCSEWRKDGRKVDGLSPEHSHEERGVRQQEKGLSLLVHHVLGKPLDKTEQLSNWEKRPLREEQILYAASDAYCLLEIYERLCRDPESFGLSSDLMESLVGKRSIKPRAKKQLNKQEALSPSGQQCQGSQMETSHAPASVSPREFSVVCDNMLQGLGRYLRCLGVDVRMLDNEDDHRKAAEIARQEGRVILTSGLPYQTLRSQVGEGRCFSVNCSEKAKEQALQVLKHFNIQVSLSDIFSRCQVCNCDKYLKVPRERMRQLVEGSRQVSQEPSAGVGGRDLLCPQLWLNTWRGEFSTHSPHQNWPLSPDSSLGHVISIMSLNMDWQPCCWLSHNTTMGGGPSPAWRTALPDLRQGGKTIAPSTAAALVQLPRLEQIPGHGRGATLRAGSWWMQVTAPSPKFMGCSSLGCRIEPGPPAVCPGSQLCDVTVPARDTAQPGCTAHREQPEELEQRGADAVLGGGTVLQVDAIPPGVLDRAELTDFYCCSCCGKVFWEGSHFGRVVSQFRDVLVASGDAQSVYELS
ncbi:PREDICTED: exonuclease mut-7 homolog [Lepidothrix coronata]|uniref:Exonuclease mut-7 homolog n=1 Tax=Lepidothrix coronata TaxID=321398 RepID=A0A6J0IU41_9PASS|nr:PREDICTED: exonuclease mut-7 homolog [Lepidothrix coronata]